MIEDFSLKEPKETLFEKHHISMLFKDIKTDYYNRYDFSDLQQYLK